MRVFSPREGGSKEEVAGFNRTVFVSLDSLCFFRDG
jgi:hypothetical protein